MKLVEKNILNAELAKYLKVENGQASINFSYNSGGYESYLYFITKDGGVLGIDTILKEIDSVDFNDEDDSQWFIVGSAVNYEDHDLYDSHTNKLIPAAYEEEDVEFINELSEKYFKQ